MSRLKIFAIVLLCIPVVALVAFTEFYLPSTALVRITGIDVKRLDTGKETPSGQAVTRDVRFIYARDIHSGKDYAFRNEDTGWGWPIYFKFNSGTLAARASNIKETEGESAVLMRYYGWRLPLFDMYPNVVNLKVVPSNYTHVPIFNIVFIIVVLALIGYLTYRIRRFRLRSSGDD
ncbi:MAG: DUF1523 family protein [Hyphomicrobiales bacterium]|nr:DUF1523 family protein [Hyphomicrobiales bacterium]